MARLFFIAAIIGFLAQTLSRAYIYVNFKINQETIARNLCVKKDEPDNCCKGHCYLNKQLDAEQKQNSSSPGETKDKEEIQYCQSLHRFQFSSSELIEVFTPHNPFFAEGTHSQIFRPPKV